MARENSSSFRLSAFDSNSERIWVILSMCEEVRSRLLCRRFLSRSTWWDMIESILRFLFIFGGG